MDGVPNTSQGLQDTNSSVSVDSSNSSMIRIPQTKQGLAQDDSLD